MKFVFMGTPEFSVGCLERLIADGHKPLAVFSQPDKPQGRKMVLTPPPVKVCAEKNSIPVFQPTTLKDGKALEILNELQPDVIVVVAYGKLLPESILSLPKYGCINVHASLLPRWRGAAPIQWSILSGDAKTGVTAMQMDAGLDTGDMLLTLKTDITPEETAETLYDRLSEMGADVISETIKMAEKGLLQPQKQPSVGSTYAKMLDKTLSPIDWHKSAAEIHNQIRGLYPWPGASFMLNGKKVKVYSSSVGEVANATAGEIVSADKSLKVACGDGKTIVLTELQAEGKSRMSATDFLRGNKPAIGSILE